MKTKEIYLLAAASMMVVVGWSAWRFAAIPSVVEPPANTSLPAQKTATPAQEATPATSPRTGRPIVSQAIEMPEMTKARLSAQTKQVQARVTALLDAHKSGGAKGLSNALKDRSKPEDMAFLKSLGLSDALSDKVYQMLRAKADLSWDPQPQMSEALRRGGEVLQMNADLEAAVGAENYRKIKYWQATLLERNQMAEFKRYLQSRSLPLTEQQEAAVVEAMRQARAGSGKATFSLRAREISMEDKLAYIDTVKQSLAPVLNAKEMAHLGQHLKEVAEIPLKLQALNELLQKRSEELKRKASNPPAPPR